MYTFKKEFEDYNLKTMRARITLESEATTMEQLIEDFKGFLLGCGFHPDVLNEYFKEEE